MQQYIHFKAEEFLNDPLFRKWLIESDEQTDRLWEDFLLRFPEKQQAVAEARTLFKALDHLQSQPSPEQGKRMWETIRGQTQHEPEGSADERPGFTFTRVWRTLAAASVLLLLGIGGWLLLRQEGIEMTASYKEQVASSETALVEKVNRGSQPLEILLPDGSRILLEPLGKVSYQASFSGRERVVYLSGKAYFRVARDGRRPFLVYANNLVTQVVGTSFTIDSPSATAQSTVVVRSGKVKVFPLDSFRKGKPGQGRKLTLLTPNQMATYDPVKAQLTRTVVKEPALLKRPEANPNFLFENTSVARVFDALEESYGVRIRYDARTIRECSLTAPLGGEPLFRKLDIICQTIGATYEVWGAEIVVTGPGCGI